MDVNHFVELHCAIKKPNGCWMWTKSLTHNGYGRVQIDRKSRKAHRVAYELANGPIPDGRQVCHHCDTPACINPDHLFLGSQLENMRDMIKKGRKVIRRGAQHWATKLTDQQIEAIRKDTRFNRIVAPEYGISKNYVNEIRRGAKRAS